MADPASSTFAGAKLIPPVVGFVGAVIMLSQMEPMPPRRWLSAILMGVLSAYLVPPIIVAYLVQQLGWAWLPTMETLGVLGLLFGLAGIHLVAAAFVLGSRFGRDPAAFIANKGEEK